MADAVITIDQLTSWVRRCCDLVIKNQAELTELDSAIGDADHGTNMARGMTVVINKLAGTHPAYVNELFKTVAMTLVTTVGGASGPGKRSAGHMDPGAASMSLLFDALATELAS